MWFKRAPLLPYFLAFCLGILTTQKIPTVGKQASILVIVGLFVGVLFWFRQFTRLTFLTLLTTFFFLGIQRTTSKSLLALPPGENFPGIPDGPQLYEGTVVSYPQVISSKTTYLVALHAWKSETSWRSLQVAAQISHLLLEVPSKGDRIRFIATLRTPRNLGNDREFDFELYAQVRGIDLVGTVGDGSKWMVVQKNESRLRQILNMMRTQAIARSDLFMEQEHASIFKSLVFGEKTNLEWKTTSAFRAQGILHLLVVSGFHISLISVFSAYFLGWLARRSTVLISKIPIWHIKVLGGLIGAGLFCSLTDLPIPTLRALLAILLGAFVLALKRKSDGLALWILLAFGVLAYEPLMIFDLSAQLSFLAVLGILLGLEAFKNPRQRSYPKKVEPLTWIKTASVATLGATFATLPVILFHFSRMTLWSPIGNLIFASILGVIGTGLGFAASFIIGPIGNYLFCCLDQLLNLVVPLLIWMADLPGTDLWVPRPTFVSMVSYASLFLLFHSWRVQPQWSSKILFCVELLLFLMTVIPFAFQIWKSRDLFGELHVLHVGQGDATLAISSKGKAILVDAGPGGKHSFDAGERVIVPWLRCHGYDQLELMILSHGDADHVGGAQAVFEQMKVKEIWIGKMQNSPLIQTIRFHSAEKGIPVQEVDTTTEAYIMDDLKIIPLSPPSTIPNSWSENNRSLVIGLEFTGYKVLLTGDIEFETEKDLGKRGTDVKADFLKIPHHGSKTSSSVGFLEHVGAKDAVITSGWKNRFHHPAPEVIERLARHGIRIWRGDQSGEIVVRVMNQSISVDAIKNLRN